VPLRIQVTFTEFEGDKKIASLPYTLNHNVTDNQTSRTSLRMGIKVPLVVGQNQVQYQNLGTDIDCNARMRRDGAFSLTLELRRSSVYTPGPDAKMVEPGPKDTVSGNPFIREFSGRVDALLRDGQTMQSTMATDPVSGRTLKVDVTVNVIK
jgi:hypothetical protein